jgi:hypothetical protein
MCLLVLEINWTNKNLSREEFEKAWNWNPDWFGMAICRDSWVEVKKTKELEEAYRLYNKTILLWDYNFIVYHFRLGTSWGYWVNMLHPFNIGKWVEFFHNWVLPFSLPHKSDTAMLAETLLAIQKGWVNILDNEVAIELLDSIADWYNKFILCNKDSYLIINEKAWHWIDNSWFSNWGYKVYNHIPWAYNTWYDYEDEDEYKKDYWKKWDLENWY